jgi:hypothetical protein
LIGSKLEQREHYALEIRDTHRMSLLVKKLLSRKILEDVRV